MLYNFYGYPVTYYAGKLQHELYSQITLVSTTAIHPEDSSLAVELQRLREQCSIVDLDFHDDDDLVSGYGKAAEKLVESHAEHCLFNRVLRLELEDLPYSLKMPCEASVIRLEKEPILAVNSVKVRNYDTQALVTIDPSNYEVYLNHRPPIIVLNRDAVYTTGFSKKRLDGIQVEFVAGVTVDGTSGLITGDFDPMALQAIQYLVATMYQKREAVHAWSNQTLVDFPLAYQSYISALSWRGF